ncbi:MAG: TAXI family TRAP transporter solute-binding subunit [Firmicutes bacterium]|nr:TAXI family TRAP transporter solute-binding subunit [Bacillota bacterium]
MKNSNVKKTLCLLIAALLSASLVACAAQSGGSAPAPAAASAEETAKEEANAPAEESKEESSMEITEPIELMMGTSGTTGSWYPVGIGLSTFWNEDLEEDGVHVFVQSTGGGGENVQMLSQGELDMATLGSITVNEAYNGLNDMPKLENLRVMFAMQATSMQPVILKKCVKTGTFADIEGLKFGVGNPGGNAEKLFNIMNEAFGNIDVEVERLSPANACDAIKNGTLDGNFFTGGAPISSIIDLMSTPNLEVQILSVTQEDVDRMNEINHMWNYAELEPGTYEGLDEKLGVAQTYDMVVITSETQEAVVYKLLEDMFNNIDKVNAINKSMSFFTMDRALNGIPCPMHAGAVKYFQDQGYTIPEDLIPPEMK